MWNLGRKLIGLAVATLLTYAAASYAQTARLDQVRTWAYQLQKADPTEIQQSYYDLVVIDYGFNQDNRGTLPREVIDKMRFKPDGTRRVILSYLSIGEAEDYRHYWRTSWKTEPPEWLGAENPNWPGNYPVQYWHPEWQSILFGSPGSYLSRIMDAGFDGIYLDGVDQFEHWQDRRPSAAGDMTDLIFRIAGYARERQKDFLIVPQNGDELLDNPRYVDLIDGFGKEELLYGERRPGQRNPADSINETVERLQQLRQKGKPVLVVEYALRPDVAASALREIERHGFIGYMSNQALDTLTLPTNDCAKRGCSR